MDEHDVGEPGIRQYLATLRRWLWPIVVGTLLAAAGAYALSRTTTPIYEATASLLIDQGQNAGGPDYNAILTSERLATTYSQLLKGRPICQAVAARLGLSLSPDQFSKLVRVEPIRDAQIIRLAVRHPDPGLAAAIANAIPQVFIERNQEMQSARFKASKESLDREMQVVQGEIGTAQQTLERERARPTPDAAESARLEALLAGYRSTYADLLQGYEAIRVAEARGVNALIVAEPAAVPSRPVLPRTMTNTVLAGVAAAMSLVAGALALEHLDDTARTPQDVERMVNLPTFASIARFAARTDGARALVAIRSRSAIAEGYRALRTSFQCGLPGTPKTGRVLLVTSARPKEGKTTTLANLGASLAQSGKRVLLVDGDLRHPELHAYFGLNDRPGLTSLLPEGGDLFRAIQRTSVSGLRVLPAGPIPTNPAEALSLPGAAALLERLRPMADYVLVDSPPALTVTDALILAQSADGVLLVIEAGRTRRDTLRAAMTALQRVKAPVLGAVLNKVSARHGSCYYDGRYYGYPAVGEARAGQQRRAGAFLGMHLAGGLVGRAQRLFAGVASRVEAARRARTGPRAAATGATSQNRRRWSDVGFARNLPGVRWAHRLLRMRRPR